MYLIIGTEKLNKFNFNFESLLTLAAGEVSVTWTINNETINILVTGEGDGIKVLKVLTVVEVVLGLHFVDVVLQLPTPGHHDCQVGPDNRVEHASGQRSSQRLRCC